MKEIKIKTPYGDKNWSFVKRVFDLHEEMIEALEATLPGLSYLAEKEPENYGPDLDCVERVLAKVKGL